MYVTADREHGALALDRRQDRLAAEMATAGLIKVSLRG
jgi:hypothetical protein